MLICRKNFIVECMRIFISLNFFNEIYAKNFSQVWGQKK